ncbi:MAG: Ferrochelatase, protoheme ferro-lyase [Bryobacterales bacterium]|nr:Ferrochelatase, protoheme ferro-lyase [Bryobacterales bacterium]
MSQYDALLIVSFGGPEKREDVVPFLENVLRGRNVPRERMLEVAEHYYHFDGRSPINDQNRALIEALRPVVKMPIYWGNRNWHPMLPETVSRMKSDGIRRAVAFVTSAFGSYSGCRQYIEDIARAQAEVGEGAPQIYKIRPFSEHPKFIEAMTDRVCAALGELPHGRLVFTAHSVPVSMAESSPYVAELERACAAVAKNVGRTDWKMVYQSRSGPPGQPWLEPDISDYLGEIRSDVVVVPLGFLSDHMEVLYDLDTEARAICEQLGVKMVRAGTVGTHPAMIEMIAELVEQEHTPCAEGCCPAPRRPVPSGLKAGPTG